MCLDEKQGGGKMILQALTRLYEDMADHPAIWPGRRAEGPQR